MGLLKLAHFPFILAMPAKKDTRRTVQNNPFYSRPRQLGKPIRLNSQYMLTLSTDSPNALRRFSGLGRFSVPNGCGGVPGPLGTAYTAPTTLFRPVAGDCTVKTISIWLNAFIPGNAPGFTKPVPGGVHAGKTMLDTGDGNCFLSNGRDFSSDLNAESMLQSRADIEIVKATGAINLTQSHRWGRIITVAPDTGKVICDIPGGPVEPQPNRLKAEVTDVTRTSEKSDFILSIIGQVPPPPPCLSGMRAPTYHVGVGVHMQISIRRSNLISEEAMVLHAAGVIENLPAFELYTSVNGGRSKRVFAFGLEGTFRSSHIRFVDQADISIRNLIVIGACSGPVDL